MKHRNIVAALVVIMTLVLVGCCVTIAVRADDAPVRTAKQDALHEAADILRAAGYSDDSDVIKALQDEWRQEQTDLSIIAKTISREADPEWCEWEHSVAVGAVVLNRVASPWFPNSVYDVIVQPRQYSVSYASGFDGIGRKSWEAAAAAMNGEHSVPADAYWQDTSPQGVCTWKIFTVDTGYYKSTTYICRGIPGVDA